MSACNTLLKGVQQEAAQRHEQPQQGARTHAFSSVWAKEMVDGCEHYDPQTMSATALREVLSQRGITWPEGAGREELVRVAEKAGIGAESVHSL